MLLKNWRTAVACAAVAAATVLVPGTAHAATPDCAINTTIQKLPGIQGIGALAAGEVVVNCLPDGLSFELGPVSGTTWVSLFAAVNGSWVLCTQSPVLPVVLGAGAAAIADLCPYPADYYKAHSHTELQYTTALSSTSVIANGGCINGGNGLMICTQDSVLVF